MWWLLPIGVGVGILKLLYDAVSEEEYEARRRWESKRKEVERSVKEHQENIEAHIQQAQNSYDFHFLVDLHYSSSQVANSAYQLLCDARSSFSGMSKMLKKSKEQRAVLQCDLEEARRNKDRKRIHETIEQLKVVNDLRKSVFDDRDRVREQKDRFLAEVRLLNSQTRELKEFIRDRCGDGGREWYQRLEARRRARRISEGKEWDC